MTCRNAKDDVETGGASGSRDKLGGDPEVCPSGIRHVGGAKPDQALVRNVRTCRPDVKGGVQAAMPRAIVPAIAWIATAAELALGIALILGVWPRWIGTLWPSLRHQVAAGLFGLLRICWSSIN